MSESISAFCSKLIFYSPNVFFSIAKYFRDLLKFKVFFKESKKMKLGLLWQYSWIESLLYRCCHEIIHIRLLFIIL